VDTSNQTNEPGVLCGLFHLSDQNPIGFEKQGDGPLFAVAGEEKVPLTAGRYCWHATEDLPSGSPKAVGILAIVEDTAGGILFMGAYASLGILYAICAAHPG